MGAWADFDAADLPPEPLTVYDDRPLSPNARANALALRDSDSFIPESAVVLVEGAQPWGRAWSDPASGRPFPKAFERSPGVMRTFDRAGTAWLGEPTGDGPCEVCRGAIAAGSRLYCPKCHASGRHEVDAKQLQRAKAREESLEARGLVEDRVLVGGRPVRLVEPMTPSNRGAVKFRFKAPKGKAAKAGKAKGKGGETDAA